VRVFYEDPASTTTRTRMRSRTGSRACTRSGTARRTPAWTSGGWKIGKPYATGTVPNGVRSEAEGWEGLHSGAGGARLAAGPRTGHRPRSPAPAAHSAWPRTSPPRTSATTEGAMARRLDGAAECGEALAGW